MHPCILRPCAERPIPEQEEHISRLLPLRPRGRGHRPLFDGQPDVPARLDKLQLRRESLVPIPQPDVGHVRHTDIIPVSTLQRDAKHEARGAQCGQ